MTRSGIWCARAPKPQRPRTTSNFGTSADPEAPNQANLVQSAIDSKVDGIAVTLAKPDAMVAAVQSATAAGIPVVALNSGLETWKDMGVKEYFGQDESIAGEAAGERLNTEGATKVLCVIQEQGQREPRITVRRCEEVVQGNDGDSQRQRQGHAVGGVDHHRETSTGPGKSIEFSRSVRRSH